MLLYKVICFGEAIHFLVIPCYQVLAFLMILQRVVEYMLDRQSLSYIASCSKQPSSTKHKECHAQLTLHASVGDNVCSSLQIHNAIFLCFRLHIPFVRVVLINQWWLYGRRLIISNSFSISTTHLSITVVTIQLQYYGRIIPVHESFHHKYIYNDY